MNIRKRSLQMSNDQGFAGDGRYVVICLLGERVDV